MITIDQHSKDQNNNVLPADWHQNMDSADPAILSVNPSALSYSQDDSPLRPQSTRPVEPVTPADAVDPIPAPANQNPSPETPGDLLSAPNDDNETSSSLSPVSSLGASREQPSNEAIHLDAAATNDPNSSPQVVVPAVSSRQSTPLTELSGPMTPSRAKDDDAGRPDGAVSPDQQAGEKNEGRENDGAADATGGVKARGSRGGSRERETRAKAKVHAKGAAPTGEGTGQPPAAPSSISSSSQHQLNGLASSSPTPADPHNSQVPGNGALNSHKTSPEPPDEKASTILQLNAELLKVCMECQTRHLMQSSEFNAYATRLQSNLTWLAAAADRERHKSIPLPLMLPPPAIPWYSTQAINDYYQRLPTLFAKEISKRQKEVAQTNAGSLKRGPDTAAEDLNGVRKRVDTGERRSANSGSGVSPPHARSPSVMSNGTVGSTSGLNMAVNMNVDHGPPVVQNINMGMMGSQQAPPQHQQPQMRVSPETMQPPNQQMPFVPGGMSEAQMVQARERARIMQLRQQQAMAAKEPQRMPPPAMPNGLQGPMPQPSGGPPVGSIGQNNNNTQVIQAILASFGQTGLQNFHAIQQGATHPFINYMSTNVPGFLQLPLQQQLQKMQVVQNNIQQARAQQQAQRAAAAASAVGMNGIHSQSGPDGSLPFSRHSGSPPNVSPSHIQPHQGQPMQHMSPSGQTAALPYAGANGIGLPMQAMQPPRAGPSVPQNMGASMVGGGLPPGMNMNNMTPQQRQLFLIQQQMHQRGNDGVMNPQQAYAQQEKLRQEQHSRMSNHHQQVSPPHTASGGSPPNPGTLPGHIGIGTPGMPGIARSGRSPTDVAPGTPRMPQKRPAQNDMYQMALYNQAQAQRHTSMGGRPGTSMGGMQQQQVGQYGANGGTINPGMMYGGAAGMNAHGPQQNWQLPQQQQVHSVSPAALQHHPDAGTPRPASSPSGNALMPGDAMGESIDSLFNWNGT